MTSVNIGAEGHTFYEVFPYSYCPPFLFYARFGYGLKVRPPFDTLGCHQLLGKIFQLNQLTDYLAKSLK